MLPFKSKPTEESYTFIIGGSFDYELYQIHWFAKNKIIDFDEMETFKTYTNDGSIKHNSQIIYFQVDKNSFKMTTYSSSTYPILFDKFITTFSKIKSTVDLKYQFRVNLHVNMRKHSKLKMALSLFTKNPLSPINSGSWSDAVQFIDEKKQKNFELYRKVLLSKCYKEEIEYRNNLHIFVINDIVLLKSEILKYLSADQNKVYNKSILICNSIIEMIME